MDHVRNTINRTSTAATARPLASRHPRILAITLAAAGVGLGIRYQADSLRKNEQAQRTSTGNYYVSVDRSGGGI